MLSFVSIFFTPSPILLGQSATSPLKILIKNYAFLIDRAAPHDQTTRTTLRSQVSGGLPMKRLAALLSVLSSVVAVGPDQAEVITGLTTSGTLVAFDSATPDRGAQHGDSVGLGSPVKRWSASTIARSMLSLVGLGYNSGNGRGQCLCHQPADGRRPHP